MGVIATAQSPDVIFGIVPSSASGYTTKNGTKID